MGDATQLYLPIVSVFGVLGSFGGIVYFAAVLKTKVAMLSSEVESIRNQMKDVPSRLEYNALKDSLERVEAKLDRLLEK